MRLEMKNLQELPNAAAAILTAFPEERIFFFYGDMGSGKTTFIHALCQALEVRDHTSSPTFSIVNEYDSPHGPLYHFDFYRLKNETEAFDMGYEEYFYSGNYCFVEWPEKIPNLLPPDHVQVRLEVTEDQGRVMTVEKK